MTYKIFKFLGKIYVKYNLFIFSHTCTSKSSIASCGFSLNQTFGLWPFMGASTDLTNSQISLDLFHLFFGIHVTYAIWREKDALSPNVAKISHVGWSKRFLWRILLGFVNRIQHTPWGRPRSRFAWIHWWVFSLYTFLHDSVTSFLLS